MLRLKIFKMPKSTFNNLTVQRHHFRELTDGLIQLFLLEELNNQDRTSNGVPFPSFYFLAVISRQKRRFRSKNAKFVQKCHRKNLKPEAEGRGGVSYRSKRFKSIKVAIRWGSNKEVAIIG